MNTTRLCPRAHTLKVARQFGSLLDRDDFVSVSRLLSKHCQYGDGEKQFSGAKAICDMYRKNMLYARKQLDEVAWGKSEVEMLSDIQAIVLFTDYIRHQGIGHTYRYKQVITVNDSYKIVSIQHQEIPEEQERLARFYEKCGISNI